jgi:hypothetical protein
LQHTSIMPGETALRGVDEYLSAHIFDAVDYDRKITGGGTLIMIFDPKRAKDTPPHRTFDNVTVDGELVPAKFEVKVIDATVKFARSAGA